jgi:hypothetical protein
MGIGGMATVSVREQLIGGLSLCILAILLMAMALDYKHIELVCKAIRMRLKR